MRKIQVTAGKRYRFATHANAILLPREEAECLEAFLVVIDPGPCAHLRKHVENEQRYYVRSGRGKARYEYPDGRVVEFALEPEDLVHVPRHTLRQIFCDGDVPLTYLCIDGFSEGIPAGEPTWGAHAQAVIKAQRAAQG